MKDHRRSSVWLAFWLVSLRSSFETATFPLSRDWNRLLARLE
jgi:hypothetical protein